MTKKDYKLIAQALRYCKPTHIEGHQFLYQRWFATVTHMALALADQDKRFKNDIFLAECGVQD